MCTGDGCLQERAGNGILGGLLGLVLATAVAHAHVRVARILHDRGHVGEVQVDKARHIDQVGDTAGTLGQHIIRNGECILEGDAGGLGHLAQTVVGDDHQGIHELSQLLDTGYGLIHAASTLKQEGLGHDTHRQGTGLTRQARDNRSRTGTGTAAHAGGDEHHVGIFQDLLDIVNGFLGRACADLRVGACAEAVGQLLTDGQFRGRIRLLEHLCIGVDGYELHTLDVGVDHTVDRVVSAAADADHLDIHAGRIAIVMFKSHIYFLPLTECFLKAHITEPPYHAVFPLLI